MLKNTCYRRSTIVRTKGAARGLFFLAVAAILAVPWAALPVTAAPTPLNVDVPVVTESFEGGLGAWLADDTNTTAGVDTWSSTTYRAANGASSLWSAANGSQVAMWDAGSIPRVPIINSTNVTIFQDSFDTGNFAANWSVSDLYDTASGNDTWGLSTARAYDGTKSIWASQVGYNDNLSADNVNVSRYDNDQYSFVWREVDLSNFTEGTMITFEFWYWMDTELWSDYLFPIYMEGAFSNSSWNYFDYWTGNSSAWTYGSFGLTNRVTAVGFALYTDYVNVFEGAYVDNVTVWAGPEPQPPQPAGPFVEDFETAGASLNWSASDTDSWNGRDYWGVSTSRAHTGTGSLWSAQFGDNSVWGGTNVNAVSYDNSMSTLAWRPIVRTNLTGFSALDFTFWFWMDTESCCDSFYPMYYTNNSGWYYLNYYSGDSGGWVQDTYQLPTDTTRVGFMFYADGSIVYEGVYIDDVELSAHRDDLNEDLRTYDTAMNATVSHPVTVSPYALAYVEYSYWMETDSGNDTLESRVFDGTRWTTLETLTGSSAGWQTSRFPIPTNTTRVGFRFFADAFGHAEGAYLDDIRVWGEVFPVNCTASVFAITGMETISPFVYTSAGADGLRPYTHRWSFSDGGESTSIGPTRFFTAVGYYNASVTITDALGQTCTAPAPMVTVTHDITAIAVTPAAATVIEGRSLTINATDAKGHPYIMDWSLAPVTCGDISNTRGTGIAFTASPNAGGLACTVTATVAGVRADASIQVTHDSSVVSLTPSTAEIVEGETISILAVDRYGHALVFGWSATCGRVAATTGSSTDFSADNGAGQTCTITATGLMSNGYAVVTIIQDTRTLAIEPSSASLVAGQSQAFSVVDARARPVEAVWSVSPGVCGDFTIASGSITIFTASEQSGGRTCTISAAAGVGLRTVDIAVRQDTSAAALSPVTATAVEGGSQLFRVLDTFGNALQVDWSVTPDNCGQFDVGHGASATLSSAPAAGGAVCTVSAVTTGVTLDAELTILHGGAETLDATASATSTQAGGRVSFEASVKDAAGHVLKSAVIAWQASCGMFDNLTGRSAVLTVANDAGATTCTVQAESGDLSWTMQLTVRRAGPFALTVQVAGSPGGPQIFTATVKDGFGAIVPDAQVTWASTCGALSTTTGPVTTFTPPGDLGGSSCKITAISTVGTATSEVAKTAVTGASTAVPALVLLLVAGAGVGGFVLMRKKKASRRALAEQAAAEQAPSEQPQEPYPPY